MTTDITELAQREKFEAWFKSSFHPDKTGPYIKDQLYFAWKAAGAELVEALEKAQQTEKTLESRNRRLDGIITAAEKRIAELESEVKFPGVMHCNTCGFSRSIVIVTPGGMRAGESVPEHCPNGCGPLWHDTYRRQYNELYDAYKELESRTVTVENLQESAYRAGLTAGWNLGLANNSDGFNKCLAAHAAGIKVEDE